MRHENEVRLMNNSLSQPTSPHSWLLPYTIDPWVFHCILSDLQTHPFYHDEKVFSAQASNAFISGVLLLLLWMISLRWTMDLSSMANPTSNSHAHDSSFVNQSHNHLEIIYRHFFRVQHNVSQCWNYQGKDTFASIRAAKL